MERHRELYNAMWSPELAKAIHAAPPTDFLLEEVLAADWDGGATLAGGKPVIGEMLFDHVGLRGPPGRLHGGLHCVARTRTILERIPGLGAGELFPYAFTVQLGAAIPLGRPIPFEAKFSRREDESWWFTSRFDGSDRLNAAAWSLESKDILTGEELERWHKRYLANKDSPDLQERPGVGVKMVGNHDLSWMHTDESMIQGSWDPIRRYVAREGFFSSTFLCVYVDNIGAMTRSLPGSMSPYFTTRVSIMLTERDIPTSQPILFLGDRAGMHPSRFTKARPVKVAGKEESTMTTEVIAVSEDFTRVYARGWVDSHPIDIKRFMAGPKDMVRDGE